MVNIFGVFTFIGTSIWPFLREWLFKSKSVKYWASRNLMSIMWFTLIFVMFIVTYNMFHMATTAHAEIRVLNEKIKTLQDGRASPQALAPFRKKIRELATDKAKLTNDNMRQTAQIVTYQNWMRACGMDFSNMNLDIHAYPVCTIHRASPTVRVPIPRTTTPPKRRTPAKKPALPKPAKTDAELQRQVEDLWETR